MIDCNTCVKFLFVVFILFAYYLLIKWRAKSTKEYQDYAKHKEQKKLLEENNDNINQ